MAVGGPPLPLVTLQPPEPPPLVPQSQPEDAKL